MPRIINPEEYQQKRGEILDAAQRLIYIKGYELMSIQDILDELGISKGAFYHYFDSKQVLLEAIVERMMREVEKFIVPIVQDPALPALTKLERFFDTIARWKTARKAFLTNLLQVWYADNNAIVRQKLSMAGEKWMSPFLWEIIQQGIREGVMEPGSPLHAEVAQVVISLMMSMGESIAMSILSIQPGDDEAQRAACLRRVENSTLAYHNAIERVLGAPAGSINIFDLGILREWVLETDSTPSSTSN